MARKLSQEEIVTLRTFNEKGQSNVEIGRTPGVSEGAVRYHLRRAAERAEELSEAVKHNRAAHQVLERLWPWRFARGGQK